MGRVSICSLDGHEHVRIDSAVDSLLESLFGIHHGVARFPEDVGSLGFLAIAPEKQSMILFTIYPSFKDTEAILDEILSEPGGMTEAYNKGLRRPGVEEVGCFLEKIHGMDSGILISLFRFRLSQAIQIASQGRYILIPASGSPDPRKCDGYWFRASITRRIFE